MGVRVFLKLNIESDISWCLLFCLIPPLKVSHWRHSQPRGRDHQGPSQRMAAVGHLPSWLATGSEHMEEETGKYFLPFFRYYCQEVQLGSLTEKTKPWSTSWSIFVTPSIYHWKVWVLDGLLVEIFNFENFSVFTCICHDAGYKVLRWNFLNRPNRRTCTSSTLNVLLN